MRFDAPAGLFSRNETVERSSGASRRAGFLRGRIFFSVAPQRVGIGWTGLFFYRGGRGGRGEIEFHASGRSRRFLAEKNRRTMIRRERSAWLPPRSSVSSAVESSFLLLRSGWELDGRGCFLTAEDTEDTEKLGSRAASGRRPPVLPAQRHRPGESGHTIPFVSGQRPNGSGVVGERLARWADDASRPVHGFPRRCLGLGERLLLRSWHLQNRTVER